MRWSQTLIPTVKQTPEGAEVASHVLMLRAGLISQVMAGAYAYLPLGLRALGKAASLVRRELEAAGAVELAAPAMTPPALLDRSGRLEGLGEELLQLTVRRQDRKSQVVLAPSHEEAVTDLVARYVSSYRQLPLLVCQTGGVFRNEPRPRHGLLRTCEHPISEAYSFDASAEALQQSYDKVLDALRQVVERCGLACLAAEACPDGVEGHALVVPAGCGDQTIAHCAECGYAATAEAARIGTRDATAPDVPLEGLRQVDTPGATTIEEVSQLLGCPARRLVKTLVYAADGEPVAVLVRGDHEASEAKVRRALGCGRLELATPEMIRQVTGAPVGFAGPVGMNRAVPIWADRDVAPLRNVVVGANRADAHLVGVNPGRDFAWDHVADVRTAGQGDPCPRCSSTLDLEPAIEIGRLARLGTRYTEPLGARFCDPEEQQHALEMGAYGLLLDRLLAAVVETSHDGDGIIWPPALAPYDVVLLPLGTADSPASEAAERLHGELVAAGVDVLLDDRDARAGVKFKDADLVGISLRVVIGDRGLAQGQLELKRRESSEKEMIDLEGAAETIAGMVRQGRTP